MNTAERKMRQLAKRYGYTGELVLVQTDKGICLVNDAEDEVIVEIRDGETEPQYVCCD